MEKEVNKMVPIYVSMRGMIYTSLTRSSFCSTSTLRRRYISSISTRKCGESSLFFSFLHLLKTYLDETNSCKSNKRHEKTTISFFLEKNKSLGEMRWYDERGPKRMSI